MMNYKSSKILNNGPALLLKFRDNVNKLVKNLTVIWEQRGHVPFTTEDKIRSTLNNLFSDLVKVFNPIEKLLRTPLIQHRPKTERYRSPRNRSESPFFTSRRRQRSESPLFTSRRSGRDDKRMLSFTPVKRKQSKHFTSLEKYYLTPKSSGRNRSSAYSSRKKGPLEGSPYSKLYPEEDESFQLDFSVPLPRVQIINSFAFRAKRYQLRGGRGIFYSNIF